MPFLFYFESEFESIALMNLLEISKRKGGFATKIVAEDLVLVPIKNNVAEMNEMFTLNEVGAFIWEAINEESTMASLTASVSAEFDVAEATANADLEQFLLQIEKMMNG